MAFRILGFQISCTTICLVHNLLAAYSLELLRIKLLPTGLVDGLRVHMPPREGEKVRALTFVRVKFQNEKDSARAVALFFYTLFFMLIKLAHLH